MINIAMRFQVHQDLTARYCWGDQAEEPLEEFLSLLQAERFGGSPLIGVGGTIAHIRTLLHVASVDSNRHEEALQAMDQALALLDAIDIKDLVGLKVDCLEAKARALEHLERHEGAYVVCLEAMRVMRVPSAAFGETILQSQDSFSHQDDFFVHR
jgi:hypothetical protein